MTFPGDEPRPELTIERVRGQRRAAVAVVVVATLVVGALVWKPWDTSSGAPPASARATFPAVAVATPTAADAQVATSTPPPPPPVVAEEPVAEPSIASDRSVFPTQGALGSVAFFTGYGPGAYCIYSSRHASRAVLKSLVVEAPLVMPNLDSPVRRVRMHVELERNSEDKIFESDWQTVARSPAQTARMNGAWPFDAALIRVPDSTGVIVYRATIVIDWLGARGRVLETQTFQPTAYGPLGDADFAPAAGGCAAAI